MKFWDAPPEPDSLEEALAIAVESWEESRHYDYLNVITLSAIAQGIPEDNMKALTKTLESLKEKYFGSGEGIKLEDDERDQFLRLMETHAVRVDVDRIRQHAAPDKAPVTSKMQFVENPKGKLLDD